MAVGKEAVSFDDIIQANRLRRKNEALAQEIFGKGRRASTPSNGNRKAGSGPSLASRIGVAKASQRATSSTPKLRPNGNSSSTNGSPNINSPRLVHQSRSATANPMTRSARTDRRNNRLYDAATSTSPENGVGDGLSIRGLAGPYVVIGQNFAPGTTAADIESAMEPSGGAIQSCRIMSSSPTVMAEMVFAEKHYADTVISMFNNKKADGRLLHLYMKQGPPTIISPPSTRKVPTEPRASQIDLTRNESPYDREREHYDRDRKRAEPEVQDGSYGFDSKPEQMDVDMVDRRDTWHDNRRDEGRNRDYGRGRDDRDRPLYSDDLYPRHRRRGFRAGTAVEIRNMGIPSYVATALRHGLGLKPPLPWLKTQ